MKNLKTIIGTLVLTVFLFGCQTNEELVEFETSSEINQASRNYRGDDENSSNEDTTMLFEFNPFTTAIQQQNIRDEFDLYLEIKTIVSCNTTRPQREVWTVTNISPTEFYTILVQLGYVNSIPPPETLLTDEDDEIKEEFALFSVTYNGDCSSN